MIRIALFVSSLALVLGSMTGCSAETSDPTPASEQSITSTEPTVVEEEKEAVGLEIDRNKLAEKPKTPSLFDQKRFDEVQPYVEKKP